MAKLSASKGCKVFEANIEKTGHFNSDDLIAKLKAEKKRGQAVWLNYTWGHNETGVIWELQLAEKIKDETDCFIHVDAAQIVGKIPRFKNLSSKLDAYSFSAHKFGALKGIGFTFIKDIKQWTPIIRGGGQQEGLRAGTENTLSVKSIIWALQDIKQDIEPVLKKRKDLEKELLKKFSSDIIIIAENSNKMNNTINVIFKEKKSDLALIHFDMAKICISSGSACKSQSILPSATLISMGYSQEYAQNSIRISFNFTQGLDNKEREQLLLAFHHFL